MRAAGRNSSTGQSVTPGFTAAERWTSATIVPFLVFWCLRGLRVQRAPLDIWSRATPKDRIPKWLLVAWEFMVRVVCYLEGMMFFCLELVYACMFDWYSVVAENGNWARNKLLICLREGRLIITNHIHSFGKTFQTVNTHKPIRIYIMIPARPTMESILILRKNLCTPYLLACLCAWVHLVCIWSIIYNDYVSFTNEEVPLLLFELLLPFANCSLFLYWCRPWCKWCS